MGPRTDWPTAAVLAGERGWPDSTARLLGAAEAEALALGMPFAEPGRRSYERAKATARAALGEEILRRGLDGRARPCRSKRPSPRHGRSSPR